MILETILSVETAVIYIQALQLLLFRPQIILEFMALIQRLSTSLFARSGSLRAELKLRSLAHQSIFPLLITTMEGSLLIEVEIFLVLTAFQFPAV